MSENNGKNGYIRWPTFWSIVTAILTGLYFIGNSVVANDRLRACEDQRIEKTITERFDTLQTDITGIKLSAARIEARLDYQKR